MSSIVGRYLGPLFVQEAPSGSINGSNVTFGLTYAPAAGAAVQLVLDGLVLTPVTHYSISNQTITMVDAPVLGQDLEASYIKA